MKKKSVGFFASVLTAILCVVTLVMMILYKNQGGTMTTAAIVAMVVAILMEVVSFFGESKVTDFTAILGIVFIAYAFSRVLGDGIWNIAESMSGIKMVGLPELANMNYTMAGLSLGSLLTGLIACFTKKSKT